MQHHISELSLLGARKGIPPKIFENFKPNILSTHKWEKSKRFSDLNPFMYGGPFTPPPLNENNQCT